MDKERVIAILMRGLDQQPKTEETCDRVPEVIEPTSTSESAPRIKPSTEQALTDRRTTAASFVESNPYALRKCGLKSRAPERRRESAERR
jgi:hypothetical protein